jgi:hypothetical protein
MRCAANVSATSHGTAMTIAIIARGGTCETPYAPSASAPSHGNATSASTNNIFFVSFLYFFVGTRAQKSSTLLVLLFFLDLFYLGARAHFLFWSF